MWMPAWAVLGGDIASIQSDALRLQGVRRQAAALDHTVHEIVQPDGSRVRQYANAQGRIFMVTWTQRGKPRMAELLGAFEHDYRTAARQVLEQPGLRRQVQLQVGDLVVQSTMHLNQHSGSAWLRSQMPASLAAAARR